MTAGCCVGVDVGGTFTDVVLGAVDGGVHVHKVLTTPDDPRQGVRRGVDEILAATGTAPANVTRFVHGTTLATNVILERRGARVAFVTTAGFGDMLQLGREARVEGDRYDLHFQKPAPPVPPESTFEVDERIGAAGEVVRPLAVDQALAVAAQVQAVEPEAVAVCLLNAHANPSHERAVADACRAALPGSYVAASSDVWPEHREYDRAMTTVMSAYVGPVMASYLAGLEAELAGLGLRCGVEVMESSGGVIGADQAARRPLATVESGGAAGVIAAGFVGSAQGLGDVISFDMGGTTAKAGVVRDGRPDVTHDFQVGGKGSFGTPRPGTGVPVKLPVVDLAEVGAGGGSLAWIDPTGALRVGPRSAGADPGPACYGRGGTRPTVTDANLVLGYLRVDEQLADGLALDRDAAVAALDQHVARPLGLSTVAAAWAVHDLVTEAMASAIHVVTVSRGVDPRPFALVAHGGAGPLHAARLAGRFGIRTTIVPWVAGVASAVGLCAADLVVHGVRSLPRPLDDRSDADEIEATFQSLESVGRADLAGDRDAGHDVELTVARAVDVRYRGQAHQVTIDIDRNRFDSEGVALLAKAFRSRYRHLYGIEPGGSLEIVNVRTTVTRLVDKLHLPTFGDRPDGSELRGGEAEVGGVPGSEAPVRVVASGEDAPAADRPGDGPVVTPTPTAVRPVHFGPEHAVGTEIHRWVDLPPGAALMGPAVVEADQTTVLVPPEHCARVDRHRSLVVTPAEADERASEAVNPDAPDEPDGQHPGGAANE